MKKLITFTLTILFLAISAKANPQPRLSDRSNMRQETKSDLRELQIFEHKLDKFSYALLVGDIINARILKEEILLDMERELREERREGLRDRMHIDPYSKRSLDARNNGRLYSRRNGVRNRNQRPVESELFILKSEIYQEFLYLRLEKGRRGIINENRHRALMYEFRDLMSWNLEQGRAAQRVIDRRRNW